MPRSELDSLFPLPIDDQGTFPEIRSRGTRRQRGLCFPTPRGSGLTNTHRPPGRAEPLASLLGRPQLEERRTPPRLLSELFASAEPGLIGRPMAKQPKNLAWSRAFPIGWLGSVWEAERSRAGLQCTPPASLHCTLVGKGGRRAGWRAGRPAGGEGVWALSR